MIKTDILREYRRKYPDMPTLKLARIIYKENSIVWNNIESIRTSLRKMEGKGGKSSSKAPIDNEFKMDKERPRNPYNLPESHVEKNDLLQLPVGCNNILLISDLHIPYHDIEAITCALDYGKEKNINTIIINGDLIDNHMVSRFESDPRKRSVKQEFAATKEFLIALRAAFPAAEIYWIKGNHCVRWEKFLLMKVREIWDDDYFHLEQRLQLNDVNVRLISDATLVRAGKLNITHGHFVFKGVFGPVNPARGAWLKAKHNIIVGHLHRPSHHPEVDINGNITAAWSTGCLCELKPNYSPIVSNAMHGFAHIIVERNGDFRVFNHQIINGKIL